MELAKAKLYRYSQNNSGGSMHVDKDIAEDVYVEAYTADEANRRAEDIGIYFDGCDNDIDCPCCGDRWYETNEYWAITNTEELIDALTSSFNTHFEKDKKCFAVIHTMDGYRHRFFSYGGIISEPRTEGLPPLEYSMTKEMFFPVL